MCCLNGLAREINSGFSARQAIKYRLVFNNAFCAILAKPVFGIKEISAGLCSDDNSC
ncbi:hypothetical protein CH1034_250031 [Klebsiella pneumoniae]|nr:hypothetical protein CH1034_250031 [Klebsiella pneumoniae]